MAMHLTIIHVQQVGCRALHHSSVNQVENKVNIEASGGIGAIINDAKKIHQGEVDIQKEACWVPSNLVINVNDKIVIVESNGIEVIIHTMWVHANDVELQELACRALWTLSTNRTRP